MRRGLFHSLAPDGETETDAAVLVVLGDLVTLGDRAVDGPVVEAPASQHSVGALALEGPAA